MANLIITNACNLSCPFCFASEYLADGDAVGAERMSLDELREQLDFLGDNAARFCGGEPTTHPDFVRMLDMALEHPTRQVFFMTNGVWPATVREHVARLPSSDMLRLRYLVNVLEPELYTDAQWNQLLEMLRTVHPLAVTLGITLYKAPMKYAHVLELAKAFRIERIRFSVASPNTTDPRSWNLDPPRDFPILAPQVHQLVKDARAQKLLVHSDCGYIPPCFFTPEQIADLTSSDGHPPAMQFSCEGPVDIGPGGEAWRCYGLYSVVRANTGRFDDVGDMALDLERRTQELKKHFMFDACLDCDWRARGECAGGCYAYRVAKSTRTRAESSLVQIGEDRALMDVVPLINADTLHPWQRADRVEWMARENDAWVPLQATPVEAFILLACDGKRTVRDVIAELERKEVLRRSTPAVTRTIRKFFQQGAIKLNPADAC